jgi:hypothetical protein
MILIMTNHPYIRVGHRRGEGGEASVTLEKKRKRVVLIEQWRDGNTRSKSLARMARLQCRGQTTRSEREGGWSDFAAELTRNRGE